MIKILIVEDGIFDFESLCDILDNGEYEITHAENLDEAKILIENNVFDVSIIDIGLDERDKGNIDGFILADYIINELKLELPILMYTSNYGNELEGITYLKRAIEIGIPKSNFKNKADFSTPEIVLAALNNVLNKI